MLKVIVIDRCKYCDGEAYVYSGEYKDEDVERPIYLPCYICKGSDEMGQALYQALREGQTSRIQALLHAAGKFP